METVEGNNAKLSKERWLEEVKRVVKGFVVPVYMIRDDVFVWVFGYTQWEMLSDVNGEPLPGDRYGRVSTSPKRIKLEVFLRYLEKFYWLVKRALEKQRAEIWEQGQLR